MFAQSDYTFEFLPRFLRKQDSRINQTKDFRSLLEPRTTMGALGCHIQPSRSHKDTTWTEHKPQN